MNTFAGNRHGRGKGQGREDGVIHLVHRLFFLCWLLWLWRKKLLLDNRPLWNRKLQVSANLFWRAEFDYTVCWLLLLLLLLLPFQSQWRSGKEIVLSKYWRCRFHNFGWIVSTYPSTKIFEIIKEGLQQVFRDPGLGLVKVLDPGI